jgi:hypothetical protein
MSGCVMKRGFPGIYACRFSRNANDLPGYCGIRLGQTCPQQCSHFENEMLE